MKFYTLFVMEDKGTKKHVCTFSQQEMDDRPEHWADQLESMREMVSNYDGRLFREQAYGVVVYDLPDAAITLACTHGRTEIYGLQA